MILILTNAFVIMLPSVGSYFHDFSKFLKLKKHGIQMLLIDAKNLSVFLFARINVLILQVEQIADIAKVTTAVKD